LFLLYESKLLYHDLLLTVGSSTHD